MILPPYNPDADFDWIRRHSGLPWLRLAINVPYLDIIQEIERSTVEYNVHRDDYAENRGWLSGCLHGKSWSSTREDSCYDDDLKHKWTDESEKFFPYTKNYFQNFWPATQYKRLRIMLLEPHGYISIHKDHTTPGLNAINIAITQPKDCNFVFEKHGSIPFVPGSAFLIDTSNNHTVFNDSDQKRWHIIVHQSFDDPRFQKLVANSYHMLYNNNNETG